MEKELVIRYQEFESKEALSAADRELMESAAAATATAYSPYSHFQVGAAVRMADGSVVTGSNQENVAYPSGLCAERTALFAASARFPGQAVEALAIVARNAAGKWVEASPCGACRQVMAEVQVRQNRPLRTLVYLKGGSIRIFSNVESLLPFSFDDSSLR